MLQYVAASGSQYIGIEEESAPHLFLLEFFIIGALELCRFDSILLFFVTR